MGSLEWFILTPDKERALLIELLPKDAQERLGVYTEDSRPVRLTTDQVAGSSKPETETNSHRGALTSS